MSDAKRPLEMQPRDLTLRREVERNLWFHFLSEARERAHPETHRMQNLVSKRVRVPISIWIAIIVVTLIVFLLR